MKISHLCVVAVVGVARPTAVKVTHVLLQRSNVLNERDRGRCLPAAGGYFRSLVALYPYLILSC